MQVIQHDKLTELAKTNWDREIPFTSERGEITDRNGEVIVTNELAPTLYFMPTQNDNIEDADKICVVMHKRSVPYMSAFEVGTSFFNPKSLTENHYLTIGHNTLEYLKTYPFIVVKKI